MVKKGENIYKRKDGRWEGRYKKGRKANGSLKYGYIYGKRYKEVKDQLHRHALYYQDIIDTQGECVISYIEWAEKWLLACKKRLKPSTYCTYKYKLKQYVFPILGHMPLNQLTSTHIQSIIYQWKSQSLEASTIHVLYQILKKSLKDACDRTLMTQIPCQGIILPKKKRKQPHSLAKSAQKKLEDTAKSVPLYQGLPVLLALNSGLRIGEISALRWEDVDLESRTIHVRRTLQRIQQQTDKTKTQLSIDYPKTDHSIRTVPMSFTVYKYLKRWKKQSSGAYVCSKRQGPTEPRLINYYFSRIRQKCDLIKTHFHHLRHTFATRCIEASADVASVSQLLGHSSSKTTLEVYTDSFIEERQRVIQQMDRSK
ncbi:tyrosine-type recombinase/integrase [Vagococcus sp. JNUCC 83]